jgi:hypothetical protein
MAVHHVVGENVLHVILAITSLCTVILQWMVLLVVPMQLFLVQMAMLLFLFFSYFPSMFFLAVILLPATISVVGLVSLPEMEAGAGVECGGLKGLRAGVLVGRGEPDIFVLQTLKQTAPCRTASCPQNSQDHQSHIMEWETGQTCYNLGRWAVHPSL